MRLSLALGIPLTELQQRTSSRDFTRYLAFFSVEPWPEQRADFNAALVAAVIARCLSESEVDPDAFAPDYWASARARAEEKRRAAAPPPEPQTPDALTRQLEQLAQLFPDAVIENKTRK